MTITNVKFYAKTKDKQTKVLESGYNGNWTERKVRSARKEAVEMLEGVGFEVERCFAVLSFGESNAN